MKYRNPKTGEVFEDIEAARVAYCESFIKKGCNGCLISIHSNGTDDMYCGDFPEAYPIEAARLMGYEVVEDNATGKEAVVKSLFCEQIGVLPGQPFIVHSYPYRNYPPMVYGEDGCVRLYSPDGQKRHKVGGRAITWIVDHPESVEPCKGYAPQEVAFKKEEPMEQKDKPRICQDLGVEVGERFNVVGCTGFDSCEYDENQRFFIDSTGTLLEEMKPGCDSPASIADGRVVCLVWNDPDRILRKPRFTEEEVAALRALYKAGVKYVVRERVLNRWITAKPEWSESMGMFTVPNGVSHQTGELPDGMFPSLRPGQAVALSDILGGDVP